MTENEKFNIIKTVMLGHAVGDALGVPVEFMSREELVKNPVTDMRGFGTYNVPAGCWSDDTSMALATLDSLKKGRVDYEEIMDNFSAWLTRDEYTPTGVLFDVGGVCRSSIVNYIKNVGIRAVDCGLSTEYSNGNGSLMRIHPIALYLFFKGLTNKEGIEIIHNASALTHAHKRSKIGCGIYAFVLWELLSGVKCDKTSIIKGICKALDFYKDEEEIKHYTERLSRLISEIDCNLQNTGALNVLEQDIKSTGYVVDSLEAALWCLLATDSYKECVLKAVNLGEDTDTIGAIAGGLAGALYGFDSIQKAWLNILKKTDYIENMCRDACKNWGIDEMHLL